MGLASFVCIVTTTLTFAFYSLTTNLQNSVQSFAESLQQRMFQTGLYSCGPGLLFWLLLLLNKEGSWVLGLQGPVAKSLFRIFILFPDLECFQWS